MCAFEVHPDQFGGQENALAWQKHGVAGGGVNVRQLVSTALLPMQKLASIQKGLQTKSPCQPNIAVSQKRLSARCEDKSAKGGYQPDVKSSQQFLPAS